MTENAVTTNEAKTVSRDDIRQAIFSAQNRKRKRKTVPLFGTEVEVRQPTVQEMRELGGSDDSSQLAIVTMLINFAFVPGTDEKVFSEGDYDMLASMPLDGDMTNIVRIVQELTSISIDDAVKN